MRPNLVRSPNVSFAATPVVHGAEGTRSVSSRPSNSTPSKYSIVTGVFPRGQCEPNALVETIRDADQPGRLVFLHWKNGVATKFDVIAGARQILIPADPTSSYFPFLCLPEGLAPHGEPRTLLDEISSTISRFVKLRPEQLRIVTAFVVATWFSDCFETAPYLWVVGPLGSGKTKLLKLLWCLCRRGLIAGDLRSGSLYQLVNSWDPTLIIDELEPGKSEASAELLRLLRTGSTVGVPAYRNGQQFTTFCPKVVASRQPLCDAALLSRGLMISILPSVDDTQLLNESAMQEVQKRFQPSLLHYRLQYFAIIRNHGIAPNLFQGLSPRLKQIGRGLIAPVHMDEAWTSELVEILRGYDVDARVERGLEPEWLVGEFLMRWCHEDEHGGMAILVGGVGFGVNRTLREHGDDIQLTARKVGSVLRSLGFRTERLGRMGRGLELSSCLKRKIHEVARHLGIDRQTIAPYAGSGSLEARYGGKPCSLCEEFDLTAGLAYADLEREPRPRVRPPRPRLFDVRD